MQVFIDDSGDPGFKTDKGSSKTFIICCIIFDDELEAERTAVRIKELRRELKKSDRFEFKFNKSSKDYRCLFLETVRNFQFRIRAIVMQKEIIRSDELRNSKASFYNYTIKQVLRHHQGTLKNARIRLDGHGNREFRKGLLVYLRNNIEPGTIKNLRFRDSNRDVLIQLADMVAGSIGRTFQKDKTDCDLYWDIIKCRNEDLWIFK
jgi:hypothetical protein